MNLSSHVQINYQYVRSQFDHLNKNEWIEMIKLFLVKLAEKPIGRLLSEKLITFVESGYIIRIQNHDFPNDRTVYPKIKFISDYEVLIVIPSIPYFTEIQTIDASLLSDINFHSHTKILTETIKLLNYEPIDYCIDLSEFSWLISTSKQTGFIALAHELIHCLHKFDNIYSNDYTEEANTIFGINSSVYRIDDIIITENTIRKEWNMPARISHDCEEIFCMYVLKTHKNAINYNKTNYFHIY